MHACTGQLRGTFLFHPRVASINFSCELLVISDFMFELARCLK